MRETPPVFNIPASQSFVDCLAAGLLEEVAGDPTALADYLLLLPTRRACRALREAFLRLNNGRAMLLPTMRPLGDVDEEELILGDMPAGLGASGVLDLPPAIAPMRRQLLLSRLVMQMPRGDSRPTRVPPRNVPCRRVSAAGRCRRCLCGSRSEVGRSRV